MIAPTPITKPVLALLCLLFIAACDGGILGTGDGGDPTIITPDDINSEATDSTDLDSVEMPIDSGISNGTDSSDSSDVISEPTTSAPDSSPFENNTNVTNRASALLRIVNTESSGSDALVARIQATDNTLVDLPGLPENTSTDYIDVPTNTPFVVALFYSEDVRASNVETPAYQTPTLTLSAGTTTTLVVRNTGDNSATPNLITPLTTGVTDAADQTYVRVVHASTSLLESGGLDIYWVNSNTMGDNGAIDLSQNHRVTSNLSYEAFASDYITLKPGNYQPIITQAGTSNVITDTDTLSITEPSVFTVVLTDNTTGSGTGTVQLLKVQDDSFSVP